ncbi:VPLPA-CTERM sorting domain-containing protein [Methylomonas methanica]|uniref:Secreted protein n=1 Tax=Methylomonas methanica (strain DSM 25384 / MC09) TaxID=857087 RepID=F9ZYR6_METMM|nr:VPLPA-CTERM sorting domain-containing protein [Methylomonas methanica]AEF98612.1 hypothetical protein Metme_0163 [Methylomonas methanica MC09]
MPLFKLTKPVLPVLLCTAFISSDVFAAGSATRSPVTPQGGDETASVEDGVVIEFNPNRDGVVSASTGLNTVTSVKVDTSHGDIHGYAEYALGQDFVYPTLNDVEAAAATGVLTLNTFLVGPANPNLPTTVDITVQLDVHGSFTIDNGAPTLLLISDLAATTFNPVLPLTGSIYQSNLNFISSALQDANNPVESIFGSSVSPLGGGESKDYAGASANILAAELNNLDAVLNLTFPVTIGDTIVFSAVVSGSASPEPDAQNNDTDVTTDIAVLSSAGAVDFSNTANLRVFLPEGYSLGGDDPLLNNIVSTTPVPLPAAVWLMAGGIALIFPVRRKRG